MNTFIVILFNSIFIFLVYAPKHRSKFFVCKILFGNKQDPNSDCDVGITYETIYMTYYIKAFNKPFISAHISFPILI